MKSTPNGSESDITACRRAVYSGAVRRPSRSQSKTGSGCSSKRPSRKNGFVIFWWASWITYSREPSNLGANQRGYSVNDPTSHVQSAHSSSQKRGPGVFPCTFRGTNQGSDHTNAACLRPRTACRRICTSSRQARVEDPSILLFQRLRPPLS
jgi:hypothetical protein